MVPPLDFRHIVRHLRRSPGYVVTTVLTFATAIGANAAIFSAVNTILLRPVPVERPDELAVVWQTDEGGHAVFELTYRHLREWTTAGETFRRAAVMGSHNWSAVLHEQDRRSRVWFAGVSADFFDTLGVHPILGRGLRADDDVPNARAVAVLNHGAWVRRFGEDPDVVGTSMVLDGSPVEIVGVMGPGVDFPRAAEFWIPVVPALATGTPPDTSNLDRVGVFYVVGRVRPGLRVTEVRQELDHLEARLDASDPGRLKWGSTTLVEPFLDHVFGPVRPALRILWAAVIVLLLIACANVSGLMLTRVWRRRHEHSIRLALGATRLAIARQWMAEVVLISCAGGVLGLAAAYWLTQAIVALAPDDLPRASDIAMDLPVAIFTFGAVIGVALVTGAMPLRQLQGASLTPRLEGERTTAGRQALRARSALLVLQIGLSVVLLVSAGLVLRSFVALQRVDLGFSPEGVLALTVQPGNPARPPNVWMEEFLARARTVPGVETAGAVLLRPLMLGPIGQGVRVILEGQPETRDAAASNPTLNHQIATTGYFETMRIPLRAGRLFSDLDRAGMPRVAIVGESAARRLWPGQDPIGRRLLMESFTPGAPGPVWRTVVGVVSDVRYRGLEEVQLDVYDPALQVGRAADNVLVRTAGDPLALTGALRALAGELDPHAIVDSVTTMQAVVDRAEAPRRLTMWLFILFAGQALGLAALGLGGLVALDVAQRGREFAIRQALGASRHAILRCALARTLRRVATGLALGLGTALVAGRIMRSLLFEIVPRDVVTYAMVLTIVLMVVVAGAWLPVRRALRSDPQSLLRSG